MGALSKMCKEQNIAKEINQVDGLKINERAFWFILRVWEALHMNYPPFKYFWKKM